jgi:tRNA A37 threonylcarbamoyladenosine dehydratase
MALKISPMKRPFAETLGLISAEEQEILRQCRVAVLGLGGVGGNDLKPRLSPDLFGDWCS